MRNIHAWRQTRGCLARRRGLKRGKQLLIGPTYKSETPAGTLVQKLGAAVSSPNVEAGP